MLIFSPILASAYRFAVNPTVEVEIVTPIIGIGDSLETIKVPVSPGSAVTILATAQNVAEEGYDYNVRTTLRIIDQEGKIYYSNEDPFPEHIVRISIVSQRIDSEMKPTTVTTKPSHLETEEWDGPLEAGALLYSGEVMMTRIKIVFSHDMPPGIYSFEILYRHEDPRNNPLYQPIITNGNLVVSVAADTPDASNIILADNGITFSKFKFAVINEAVELQALTISLQEADVNEVPDFDVIHLYNGATEVSSSGYLVGTNTEADVTYTFYMSVIIPKDSSITLTLKADLNGIATGATPGHTPRFYLANVTGLTNLIECDIKAKGLSSNATVTSSAGMPNPEIPTNFNEMNLVKTKPTFTFLEQKGWAGILFPLSSQRVLDFTIAADNAGDIIFDGSTDSITFKVSGHQAQDDLTIKADIITVYRSDTGAAVGTTSAPNSLDVGDTVSVTITDEIPAGIIRSYYVECSLNDYKNNYDRFKLSITETVWSDGTVEGANISNSLTDGLPLEGYMFVNNP